MSSKRPTRTVPGAHWRDRAAYPPATASDSVLDAEFARRGTRVASNGLCAFVRFELSRSLPAQLTEARAKLAALQAQQHPERAQVRRRSKRKNREQLIDALRAIDAVHAGASLPEIAAVLYPSVETDLARRRLHYLLKRATVLIERGLA